MSNLARVLPTAGVRIDSWPDAAPLWRWISERTTPAERFETFNMGVGFMLVVGAGDVDAVVAAASGALREGPGPVGEAAVDVVGRIVDDLPPGAISFRAAGATLRADRKSVEPA